ncbi:hypothetical protein [Nocardioides sp. LS1]|uniref:hypothetical protein n=1 Tax=Nocardioides sp. LS1 TaxID=1027620 RepID=UPI000F6217DE|nr:hypothetical protein [Nocardioides sp. LS1]GCD89987.1 hypothetical protein NLS1_19930 [Nocardioides sp. LS1]
MTSWTRVPVAVSAEVGLATAALLVVVSTVPAAPLSTLALALVGAAASATGASLHPVGPPARLVRDVLAGAAAALALGILLVVPIDPLAVAAWGLGALATSASVPALLGVAVVAQVATVAGAGAWSADEPRRATAAQLRAGNGVVVEVDTHAFLLQQAVTILRNDGRVAEADFLSSADPAAPYARNADGSPTTHRESYLWRAQLGSVDADGKNKASQMPDHFFNWWTHSGKGTISGPSAATWAEEQFAEAVQAWRHGDRSTAMYHLGAAAHLVDDACAPPHASPFVPNHRAYEEWVVPRQAEHAVTSGGIYRTDFRLHTGHGGDEWSSSHTRGWVDECAHRAAGLQINTAHPPPGDPADAADYESTIAHFEETQRLTAGYLDFFFEQMGAFR